MSRARATALALVNWKGVFYERYLFDRHVTALEGANGAGKTTVMIAAYVVLLPDMSRLRFTNLGETSATGGDRGIWGRLGEPGRPSYAALEIAVGSRKFVAGVHLERKSEPTVTLTPFLVKDVDLDGRLKEILLISGEDHDEVPELADLKKSVARASGKLEVFSTAKEYFAALFELGITPLRLATDEDRNKLNEMLRTSMTGGISRALTSELRSFLLKEETGLSDTLSRMRGNLDACHRTRTEVGEARHLEQEISAIFDNGQAMFSAALFAARERSKEATARLDEARAAHDEAARQLRNLDADLEEARRKHELYKSRLPETIRVAEEAREHESKLTRARTIARRLAELTGEVADKNEMVARARERYESATAARVSAREARDRARDAYERAATGVGDLEKGLEELHQNAHAYRRIRRRFEEAREALGLAELAEDAVAPTLERERERLAELDRERSHIDRDRESAEARRSEYERATGALAALAAHGTEEGTPHERARTVLARLADREALLARSAELPAERSRAGQLAEQQARAKARAMELGITTGDAPAEALQRYLDEAEAEVRAAEDEARSEDGRAFEARRNLMAVQASAADLSSRVEKWVEYLVRLDSLEKRIALEARTRSGVSAARNQLLADAERERHALAELKERHEARLREASALEAAGGAFDSELMHLRDELDAELLAARFEELDGDEAAALQAQLGPLENALIVDDPQAAAEVVSKMSRSLTSVLLVGAHAALGLDEKRAVRRGTDVFVEEPFGVRVTRLPAQPSLGRSARERRAKGLREEAEALEKELESALSRLRKSEDALRDADELLGEWAILEAGDPRGEAERTQKEAADLADRVDASTSRAKIARERAANVRVRLTALRTLLSDAYLLVPPDYATRFAELTATLNAVETARAELAQAARDRAVLAQLVDALRSAPPAGDDATLETRRKELDGERDRAYAAVSALAEVAENAHALRFEGAERALAERTAIVPALSAQRATAKSEWEAKETAVAAADSAWEGAAGAQQKADAALEAVRAHQQRAQDELAAEGLEAGSDSVSEEALVSAHRRAMEADTERKTFEREERRIGTEVALLEERRAQSQRGVLAAEARLRQVEGEVAPAQEEWTNLERAAEEAGVLAAALAPRGTSYRGRKSVALAAEARSKGELLVERLRGSRGNAECAAELSTLLMRESNTPASAYLAAWLLTRDVLHRCLPSQVAEVADPMEALQRLRDYLSLLEERLLRQETDLRGASEDVARGIDVRLRRAKTQVRRLNQSLDGIRFGNIVGIRTEMKRIDKMEQILRALRAGEVQELLFQTSLPIEQALDEIFRRYGGGGRAGGQRILDYREYVELGVEIQRVGGEGWEAASPTRLSTGEAIGVGAALMMVILTEWERDANLLTQKRETGSLRFLFLDEANRLSQDNLGVLFDLCQNLDLQLLIAAPEVARAEGNTTYRLVRRVDEDGREEVVVSGRRVHAEAPELPQTTTDAFQPSGV
jgi:chromosome partition protein MukB